MTRESFLERVRAAALAGRQYRVHTRATAPDAGYVGGGPDLCQRLADEIAAVGGRPHLVGARAEARQVLAALFEQFQVRQALCWRHPLLDALDVGGLLAGRGAERLDYDALAPLDPAERRRRILGCDLGLTSATRAVAETGSLAMASAAGRERLASLAPPVHVAVVCRDQILPDLFDLFEERERLGFEKLPSNLSLITGPSKTGDLELRLVTGVHGPGAWHVVIVRQTQEELASA